MIFYWSLSDSKSPQVSRTLLSILANLNIAVVWMVSTRPHISKSSGPFTKHLNIVPSAPITTGITITFMSHKFSFLVLWPGLCIYLSFRSLLILLCGLPGRQSSLFSWFFLFFFLTITRSGRLANIRWFVCISKSLRTMSDSFSRMNSELCIYKVSQYTMWLLITLLIIMCCLFYFKSENSILQ